MHDDVTVAGQQEQHWIVTVISFPFEEYHANQAYYPPSSEIPVSKQNNYHGNEPQKESLYDSIGTLASSE